MARFPYTTPCHFFSDSDEVNDIVWYPCNPGAPDLPYPTVIRNTAMQDDNWRQWSPGEIYDPFDRPYNGKLPIPGVPAGHICGTPEDFANGCSLTDPRPPLEYRADGLPACCGGVVVGSGGAGAGGSAVVAVSANPGPTCLAASAVAFGVPFGGTITGPPTTIHWWKLPPLVIGQTYHATITYLPGSVAGLSFNVVWPSCSGGVLINQVVPFTGTCIQWVEPAGTNNARLELYIPFFATGPCIYSMVVNPGPC